MLYPTAELCPPHLQQSITEFVTFGRPTGGFLRAVIENDLLESVARADPQNVVLLPHVAQFVRENVPASLLGSAEAYDRHVESMTRARRHSADDCMCSASRGRNHSGLCERCARAGCQNDGAADPCRVTGEVRA